MGSCKSVLKLSLGGRMGSNTYEPLVRSDKQEGASIDGVLPRSSGCLPLSFPLWSPCLGFDCGPSCILTSSSASVAIPFPFLFGLFALDPITDAPASSASAAVSFPFLFDLSALDSSTGPLHSHPHLVSCVLVCS